MPEQSPAPLVLLPGLICNETVWSPVEQHRAIAAVIPGAELVIFEHAGHMAHYEAPAEVSAALCRWLERPVPEWA